MITRTFAAAAFTIIGIMLTAQSGKAQHADSDLRTQLVTVKMEHQPLGKVFRKLIFEYGVRIGFEESVLDSTHRDFDFETSELPGMRPARVSPNGPLMTIDREFDTKGHWITINAEGTPLQEVLDSIVAQMKNYRWELNDGVINIYPLEGRDARYADLLNLKISHYKANKGGSAGLLRNFIFELPEVIQFLAENKIFSTYQRREFDSRPLKTDIELSNMSLRTVLNDIAKAKGEGGWIVRLNKLFVTPGKEFIEIEI